MRPLSARRRLVVLVPIALVVFVPLGLIHAIAERDGAEPRLHSAPPA